MRKILFVYSTLIFAFFVVSCSNSVEQTADTTEAKVENVVVADFAIEGMVCEMGCAKTIEEEIGELNGVVTSSVDFKTGKAHFEYDQSKLSEKEIIAGIEKIADGQYKVKPWQENSSNATNESEAETTTDESKDKIRVNIPEFQIPNLFTFLINQV